MLGSSINDINTPSQQVRNTETESAFNNFYDELKNKHYTVIFNHKRIPVSRETKGKMIIEKERDKRNITEFNKKSLALSISALSAYERLKSVVKYACEYMIKNEIRFKENIFKESSISEGEDDKEYSIRHTADYFIYLLFLDSNNKVSDIFKKKILNFLTEKLSVSDTEQEVNTDQNLSTGQNIVRSQSRKELSHCSAEESRAICNKLREYVIDYINALDNLFTQSLDFSIQSIRKLSGTAYSEKMGEIELPNIPFSSVESELYSCNQDSQNIRFSLFSTIRELLGENVSYGQSISEEELNREFLSL